MRGAVPPLQNFLRLGCLVKHRDNFTLPSLTLPLLQWEHKQTELLNYNEYTVTLKGIPRDVNAMCEK
jgi:hypothetical protein